jgi:hypothetical protein
MGVWRRVKFAGSEKVLSYEGTQESPPCCHLWKMDVDHCLLAFVGLPGSKSETM